MNRTSREIPKPIRAALESGPDPSMVSAALAAEWMREGNYTRQELMLMLLPVAQGFARSPVSHFQVGAIAMGMPVPGAPDSLGNLYLGASYEFQHEALSLVVHAEQSAVNNALLHGEPGLQSIAITAPPCGYCRQFMFEVSTALDGLAILIAGDGDGASPGYVEKPLVDLLPDPFGPADLGMKNELMLPRDHGLQSPSTDPLVLATAAAMNASYAPYSKNYSAVGLQRADGSVFTGRYAENAAYNPSLLPMESALSQMNLLIPVQSDLEISAACLVEAAATISQRDAAVDALSVVAPGIELRHFVVSS